MIRDVGGGGKLGLRVLKLKLKKVGLRFQSRGLNSDYGFNPILRFQIKVLNLGWGLKIGV